ncbi:OapC/ArvC family zinc-ribbon domain-containing protein [Haloprofundus salinisoli]|uniref:OapC/ArvC family zinc-ribbon domain-containing protein n=1 Tax=Haloprofundus salinisoli TaxID=2876193 RepID=UPI001CCD0433|nr:Zn-ribbon containing protein [Haloprofundus salinisoli]
MSPDEISRAAPAETPQSAGDTDDTAEVDDKPDLSTLREELNEQFESIKIVSLGQYELNLMELYDRDSYIISLQEDGHYVIEVPETWNRDND